MMMKIFCFVLSLTLVVSPVSASSTTVEGLKALYDDYHYSITVEWDQKDKTFFKQAENTFKDGIEKLREKGLTNDELIAFAGSQFSDKKMKDDFENLSRKIKTENLSKAEANKLVSDIVKDGYKRGASWNGMTVVYTFAGIAAAAILATIVYFAFACTKPGNDLNCEFTVEDNDGWSGSSGSGNCTTYYDEYGEWTEC